LGELTGHRGPVYSIISFKNGVISGGSDRMAVYWENVSVDSGRVLARTTGYIFSLFYLAEKELLLAANSEGGVHVTNLATNEELRLLKFHSAAVFDMIPIPEHNLFVTAGGDGTIAFCALNDFSIKYQVQISEKKTRCLLYHPVEEWVAAGSSDGRITIINLGDLKIINQFHAHHPDFSVNTMVLSPDGKTLITGGRDACINYFNIQDNFRKISSVPAHNYSVYSIVFSPDGSMMASASRDRTIKIWDTRTGSVIMRITDATHGSHKYSVNRILWTREYLISGSDDRKVIVWKINQ